MRHSRRREKMGLGREPKGRRSLAYARNWKQFSMTRMTVCGSDGGGWRSRQGQSGGLRNCVKQLALLNSTEPYLLVWVLKRVLKFQQGSTILCDNKGHTSVLLRVMVKQEEYVWQSFPRSMGGAVGDRALTSSSILTRFWVFFLCRCWRSSSVGNGQVS